VTDYLFVYGTLRSEFSNPYARRLHAESHLAGRASVAGSIYLIDHYPAYRPDPHGEVHGELYHLKTPAETLEALDHYEGTDFRRVRTRILTGGMAGQPAWIYEFESDPPASARIESGDFCSP
jgi:gamma-glutamylcyclotransferase (GGCT)/AIG2-like uncharacterized protein YtfP